jgi:hypothetical protein
MGPVSSIFGQLLKFFPRRMFDAAVQKHEGDKHAKGMTCWSQFIALMSPWRSQIAARNYWRTGRQRREVEASGGRAGASAFHSGLHQ